MTGPGGETAGWFGRLLYLPALVASFLTRRILEFNEELEQSGTGEGVAVYAVDMVLELPDYARPLENEHDVAELEQIANSIYALGRSCLGTLEVWSDRRDAERRVLEVLDELGDDLNSVLMVRCHRLNAPVTFYEVRPTHWDQEFS